MKGWKDVTSLMRFGNPDDECLPVHKCVCGEEFEHWGFIIGIDEEYPYGCPFCGREFMFRQKIEIWEKEK